MPGVAGVNPKGFWEHQDVVAIHDRLLAVLGSSWDDERPLKADWWLRPDVAGFRAELMTIVRRDFSTCPLWLLKDPRMCRVLPLWLDILAALDIRAGFVVSLRHPLEVVQSLYRRDGIQDARACLLWIEHLRSSEYWTLGHSRTFVTYETLLADWRAVVRQIAADLAVELSVTDCQKDIEGFLESSLRHYHARSEETADSRLAQLACEAYEMASSGNGLAGLGENLGTIFAEAEQIGDVVAPWTAEIVALRVRKHELESQSAYLASANDQCLREIERIKSTVSWQVTKPLRLLSFMWRKLNAYFAGAF
jgi:hypothetical protein